MYSSCLAGRPGSGRKHVRIHGGIRAGLAWPVGGMSSGCGSRRLGRLRDAEAANSRRTASDRTRRVRRGTCATPSGSFRRPVLCRIVNPARCRRSDGSRRITAVRTRSHRGRRGHRADSRPYAGRCRGNRWGTASCQRWRRRRNVHVVPNTSEESTSLSRPGCSSPPSRLSPDPHTVPAGTVRARPRRRPPSRSESSPRPPGAGVSAAAAHRPAPPWLRRNTRP